MTGNMNAKRGQFLKMLGAELCVGEVDERGNIQMIQAQPVAPPATAGGQLRCNKCIANKTVQRCKKTL